MQNCNIILWHLVWWSLCSWWSSWPNFEFVRDLGLDFNILLALGINGPSVNKSFHRCIQMYFGTVWMVWVPKKMHPKSSCNLFSTFHIKTIRNIVCEYLKTKIFSWDTNILPQMHWKSNIFGHSATTTRGFWVSLNYPILNSEKTLRPKIVWMQHCI